MGAQARGLDVSVGKSPTKEDVAEELIENFATELESVVRRYAPKIKEFYRNVRDPQTLDGAIDYVIARVIRALEHDAGYAFDIASIYSLEDYLERQLVAEVDE
jgi:hypothetical protein